MNAMRRAGWITTMTVACAGASLLGACSSEARVGATEGTRAGGGAADGTSAGGAGAAARDAAGNASGGDADSAVREIAPGLAIVSSRAAEGTLRAEDLLPVAGARQEWRVLESKNEGAAASANSPFEFVAAASSRFGAEYEISEGPDQTLYLVGVESHAPAMVASVSRRDAAVSRFEPALRMGSPQLQGGGTVEGSAAMTVLTSAEPMKERDHGRAARRLAYSRDETIRTPWGDRRCQRVEVEFKADLGMAKATVNSVRWILPGFGPVAETRRERIVVMGLIPTERSRVIVRESPAVLADSNGGVK